MSRTVVGLTAISESESKPTLTPPGAVVGVEVQLLTELTAESALMQSS